MYVLYVLYVLYECISAIELLIVQSSFCYCETGISKFLQLIALLTQYIKFRQGKVRQKHWLYWTKIFFINSITFNISLRNILITVNRHWHWIVILFKW